MTKKQGETIINTENKSPYFPRILTKYKINIENMFVLKSSFQKVTTFCKSPYFYEETGTRL